MPPKTHGLTKNRLYLVWYSMIRRCNNPNDIAYRFYGEQGIHVCREWEESVEKFVQYVSNLPNFNKKGYTLDRIDSKGIYEPGNVRWATAKQQQRNKKSNRLISFNGETKCINEWAETVGIPTYLLHTRLRRNWSIEEALTRPAARYRKEV